MVIEIAQIHIEVHEKKSLQKKFKYLKSIS
jgi:hypothetical protein